MRDSDKYMAQAETVAGMVARSSSPAERQVYENIAEGWRKLAAEARRNERREGGASDRSERADGPGDAPFRRVG